MADTLTLSSYRPLGRSGLQVSPLSLGKIALGADWAGPPIPGTRHRHYLEEIQKLDEVTSQSHVSGARYNDQDPMMLDH